MHAYISQRIAEVKELKKKRQNNENVENQGLIFYFISFHIQTGCPGKGVVTISGGIQETSGCGA